MNFNDWAAVSQIILAAVTMINLLIVLRSSYTITRVEKNTNSLTERLVDEVRIASIAKGIIEGRKELKKHGTSNR